ncbi:MAG: hypothetical protein JO220_06260 [Hyphomicrobiales bacterium]|nr:hypothetical protein [Hyphomicrobiales bacterium]
MSERPKTMAKQSNNNPEQGARELFPTPLHPAQAGEGSEGALITFCCLQIVADS